MCEQDQPDDTRWDRLVHLFAGELPEPEAFALRRWIDSDPARRSAVAGLEAIWRASGQTYHSWDAEAALRRIRLEAQGDGARLESGRVIARVGPVLQPIERDRYARALQVAAVFIIMAGAGLFWRLRPRVVEPPSPITWSEYRAARGERATFRLSDGTEVSLGPGSVLRRPSTYGAADRTVRLEGEAHFIVTHDSTRPFSVWTAHAVARDLGTRFIVRAYADESATEIVVAQGLVAVGRVTQAAPVSGSPPTNLPLSPDSLVLKPRQRAMITSAGRMTFSPRVSLDRYFDWTKGRLVFDKSPLREVVRRLERWYGIDVRLTEATLGELRLTATLGDEPAGDALAVIAASLELTLSRSQSTYVLGRVRR